MNILKNILEIGFQQSTKWDNIVACSKGPSHQEESQGFSTVYGGTVNITVLALNSYDPIVKPHRECFYK